jgi:hypothetical protein
MEVNHLRKPMTLNNVRGHDRSFAVVLDHSKCEIQINNN